MKIREATLSDLKQINSFLNDMKMIILDEHSFLQNYRKIYVIEYNQMVIAFICFIILSDEIELEAIYVASDFRNQGCASLLLQKLVEVGKKYSCTTVFLEVRESNHVAIKMYLKNDFKEINRRKLYYGSEDGLIMCSEIR